LIAPVRKTRGDDVMAACGQLKSESQRLSWKERQQKNPEKVS
jgi:adenine C2-methylase RlmN of 23S rRNA A2503 and tRNA A37